MPLMVERPFASPFQCEALDELPGVGDVHRFPADRAAGNDGVILSISPEGRTAWIGMFAFGDFGSAGVTRILTMPDPDALCVIARGERYIASVNEVGGWEPVGALPVLDVRVSLSQHLVLFVGPTHVLAHDSRGLRWRTQRLALDGVKVKALSDTTLSCECDHAFESREVTVDLLTGFSSGGLDRL